MADRFTITLLDIKNPIAKNKKPIYRIYYKGALFNQDKDTILCKEFDSLIEFTKCYINFAISSYTIVSVKVDNIYLEE